MNDLKSCSTNENGGMQANCSLQGSGIGLGVLRDEVCRPPKVTLYVKGLPAPGGSKKAFPFKKKDGGIGVAVTDAGGLKTKAWRSAVKANAVNAMMGRKMLQGALGLQITFFMPRPKSHLNCQGKVRGNAPLFHVIRPDATKLTRSTEDAMTGIVYDDDAQIVKQFIVKRYETELYGPGAVIEVFEWRN